MKRQAALGFIFVTVLLDMVGVGIIIPVLPTLIKQLMNGEKETSSMIYGLLAAVYASMQFVFAPILGSLSDRFGRRPIILWSLFGAGIDYLFLSIAPSIGWLFIGRIIAGITGANFTAASAYIADISVPEKRAQNFGILGAAFGIGFIAGPVLGGFLGNKNPHLPFIVAGIITLLNWLYGFFVLPESLKPENRRQFSWRLSNPIGSLSVLSRYKTVFAIIWAFFVTNIAHRILESIWVLYVMHRYNWQQSQVGISLALFGVTSIIAQIGLIRFAIKVFGDQKAIIVGGIIVAISFILYGLASEGWMIYLILLFESFGAIAGPAMQGFISKNVPDNEQGLVQGALTSLTSITGIIGPLISTSVFGFFIAKSSPIYLPGAPFFVSALLIIIGLILVARAFRKIRFKAN